MKIRRIQYGFLSHKNYTGKRSIYVHKYFPGEDICITLFSKNGNINLLDRDKELKDLYIFPKKISWIYTHEVNVILQFRPIMYNKLEDLLTNHFDDIFL